MLLIFYFIVCILATSTTKLDVSYNYACCVDVWMFSGGTTVYIHGTGLNRVDESRLLVTMIYTRLNSSGITITHDTNFTSDVREFTYETLTLKQ